ncbi:MAG TPA: hypothetical protein VMI94_24445 [Bryobacteraceae bacterium]|nr:hypothetical protein [Bryobacteraceae bacterium]
MFRMRILLASLASLCLLLVLPAYGSIIVVSGEVTEIPAPASIQPGQLLSDSAIYLFNEQVDLTLPSSVTVGISQPGSYTVGGSTPLTPGTLAAGVTVNSYLLRAAPESNPADANNRQFEGEITFGDGEKIIGIMLGADNIGATDIIFGAPGTSYPPGSLANGGLEPGDFIWVSGNDETVYVSFHVDADTSGMDMIRILTSTVPEPADFLLMGSGLAVLGLLKRQSLRRLFHR